MDLPHFQEISSLEKTADFAASISEIISKGDVIVLNGDLGTGKTTLVKYICSNYDIHDVSSPSFSIVNEYLGNEKIYHFDFYRLKKLEELYDLGFEEYLSDESAIIFIEWGNLMQEILPKNHYELTIELDTSGNRNIIFCKNI